MSGGTGKWEKPEDDAALISTLRSVGMAPVIEESETSEGFKIPEPLRTNLIDTDPEMFALNHEAWQRWCNYELVPTTFSTPTLFVNGEKEDPELRGELLARRIPNSKALTLKGLGHLGAFVRSSLVLPTAIEFLKLKSRH